MSEQNQGTARAANPRVMIGVIVAVIIAAVAAAGIYVSQMGYHKVKIKNRAKQQLEVKASIGAQNWESKLADEEDLQLKFKVIEASPLTMTVTYEDGKTTTGQFGLFAPDAAVDGDLRIKKKEIREEFGE